MKPTVYLETTVISYLAAKPSRDLIIAGASADNQGLVETCLALV